MHTSYHLLFDCGMICIQVQENDQSFQTVVKAGGLMDVKECYGWDGAPKVYRRRDKRKGVHTGFVTRSEDGHPVIR